MADIPDQEAQVMRNALALLQEMEGNPDAKAALEKAIKVVRPNVTTEADIAERIAAPYVAQIDEVRGQLKEFLDGQAQRDKEAAERAAVADTDAAFARLKSKGYTDEGLEKIKGLMVDRKIADPEAAAALFNQQNPPAAHEQSGWTPQAWEIGTTAASNVDLKELFQNEEAWADREVSTALNEIRLAKSAA